MADSDNESGGHNNNDLSAREQDRFLPIANVSRIMKKALPANAKISKDAKETVQECVISFITGEASDKCQREKRKTINGDDLLWAMTTLAFEEYVEPLKVYLAKYREIEGEKSVGGRPADVAGAGVSAGSDAASGYNNNNNNGMYVGVGRYPQQQQQHHMYNSGYNNQGLGTGAGNLGRSGSFGGRGSGVGGGGGSGSGSTLKPSR